MPVPGYKDLTGEVIAFSYYGLMKTGDNIEIPNNTGGGRDPAVIANNPAVNTGCTTRAVAGISDGCGNRTSLMLGRNLAGATMCGPFFINDNGNYGLIDQVNCSTGGLENCTVALQVSNGGVCIADALYVDGSVGTMTSKIRGNFCVTGNTVLGDDNEIDSLVSCGNFHVGGTDAVDGRCFTVDATDGDTWICGTLDVDLSTCLRNTLTVNGEIRGCADIIAFYTSDERLKTDLNRIENSNSIINSLTGYTFNWDSTKIDREGSDIGIMAQDAQKVLPAIVKERDNGYLAVDYIKLIPVMIEEIKSLNNRIITLEEQLNN